MMATMSVIGTIHEDVTSEVLGNIGAWQWTVTILSTTLAVPIIFNQYEDSFVLQPPDGVVCENSYKASNVSLCAYYTINGTEVMCDIWQVRFMWLVWIRRTWLIFCDKDQIMLLNFTVTSRFGLVIGSIIFGLIADGFGRKIAIYINIIPEPILRLALTLCDSESWYLLLIFLKSILTSGLHYLGIVLVCEIASNKWRTALGIFVSLPRLMASICILTIANSAPNFETYNFIAFFVCLLPLFVIRWIPESPQWLLYNTRISTAEKILVDAAKKNRVELCNDFKIRPVDHRAYRCLDEERTCLSVFCTYNVRVLVFCCLLTWTLYFFLLSPIYIKVYKEPRYAAIKILPTTAFMGILNVCLEKRIKLRCLLVINIFILGTSTCVIVLAKKLHLSVLTIEIVSTIGMASGVISHALLLNITPRILATKSRATFFGSCISAGNLGTIIGYLLSPRDIHEVTMVTVCVVITLVLICMCVILPDIDGRELPDTFKDMDYFSELSKPLRWVAQRTNSPSGEESEMRVHSFSIEGNDSDEINPPQPIGLRRIWLYVLKTCR